MSLLWFRCILSLASLFSIAVMAALTFFYGEGLNTTQVGLLTLFGSALIAEVKTSSAYLFDGTAKEK